MLIYTDVFTGDELGNDGYPMKLVEGVVYEFEGKYVSRKIESIVLDGAIGSDDEEGEEAEAALEYGVDFLLNLPHQETSFGISGFNIYLLGYLNRLKDYLVEHRKSEDEVKRFAKGVNLVFKDLMVRERFEKLQFFVGEQYGGRDLGGQVCIVEYRDVEGKQIPFLMLIKEGLTETQV